MAAGDTELGERTESSPFNAVWFLKRLVLGTTILFVSLGSLAWLTHAAIDENSGSTENVLDTIGRLATQF